MSLCNTTLSEISKQTSTNKTTKDCINVLSTLEIPKLTKTQKAFCENYPTEENLYDALSGMAKEKTPGNDGLTCEFYLIFWDKIKIPFINSLRESKYKKELSSSQRQAIIKLLEKKDRDKRFIKNWRPISLLNVDLKIISKAFAIKMK